MSKPIPAPPGYQRVDELALEVSKLTINDSASENSPLRRIIVEAFEAHAGTVKDWLQEWTNKGDIQPRSILSNLPEPKPPTLEHLSDWVVSEGDAMKIKGLFATLIKAGKSNSTNTAPAKDAEAIPSAVPKVASGRLAVQAVAKGTAAPAQTWQEQARGIAEECFARDTANDCRDSLKGYAARVMDEMQKRGIHGPRGRIDNPNTIQRDALQGKKWWAHKSK